MPKPLPKTVGNSGLLLTPCASPKLRAPQCKLEPLHCDCNAAWSMRRQSAQPARQHVQSLTLLYVHSSTLAAHSCFKFTAEVKVAGSCEMVHLRVYTQNVLSRLHACTCCADLCGGTFVAPAGLFHILHCYSRR